MATDDHTSNECDCSVCRAMRKAKEISDTTTEPEIDFLKLNMLKSWQVGSSEAN